MYLGCRFYPCVYVEFSHIPLEKSDLHVFPCTINCQTRDIGQVHFVKNDEKRTHGMCRIIRSEEQREQRGCTVAFTHPSKWIAVSEQMPTICPSSFDGDEDMVESRLGVCWTKRFDTRANGLCLSGPCRARNNDERLRCKGSEQAGTHCYHVVWHLQNCIMYPENWTDD
jgi:hypothetical protein